MPKSYQTHTIPGWTDFLKSVQRVTGGIIHEEDLTFSDQKIANIEVFWFLYEEAKFSYPDDKILQNALKEFGCELLNHEHQLNRSRPAAPELKAFNGDRPCVSGEPRNPAKEVASLKNIRANIPRE